MLDLDLVPEMLGPDQRLYPDKYLGVGEGLPVRDGQLTEAVFLPWALCTNCFDPSPGQLFEAEMNVLSWEFQCFAQDSFAPMPRPSYRRFSLHQERLIG